ncbi:hypothetical protein FA95DRAFT_1552598 [Auriscalpium vulgare]|uniref:Uncharacterized protein n=1 Tax=Auriscalpium vulgare TaxID=40419 RepID=A0ACB8S913_9AGAM|nr:hypothetical protein FA95DRAFT_1552598 [Auriscalpium vulgare]
MSNLTHFEYWSSYAWPGEPFDPTRLGTMLRERCPKLQVRELSIRVRSTDIVNSFCPSA